MLGDKLLFQHMQQIKEIIPPMAQLKQVLWIAFLTFTATIILIPVFTYFYFIQDLKSKESIMNKNDTGLVLLDRNNKPFFTFYAGRVKTVIPLSKIPQSLQQALIVSEDKGFYTHPGFSIRGIFRSLYLDLSKQNVAYGGSTITQQLVKNVLLTSNKSFLRKYQEIVLAAEIERRYKKNEILEMYLNSVYFGQGAFGIENASLTYFGKHAKDLNLAEGSLLVAILPSPSRLSPLYGISPEAKNRQDLVLQKMVSAGYLTQEEKVHIEKTKIVFSPVREDINSTATHFALLVKKELLSRFGEERISRSGFRVRTTLDINWQKFAEKTVLDQVNRLTFNNVSNGSAVVIDPKTGEVRALVGSKDWYNEKFGKFNMAEAPRSPGSSFKPLVYALAFENRMITPATVLDDAPTVFPTNYKPLDYDRKFRGKVLVRRALANSLNIPAVEVMQKVGVMQTLNFARQMGITSLKNPSDYGLSLVLGTGEVPLLEMTNVFATFANQGLKNNITTILTIEDKSGNKIFYPKAVPDQAVEPEAAFLVSSILSDNAARYESFGNALTISRPAAVKTGTAEDYRDALTIGYTPSLAVGVWVGNNDNSPMDRIAGSLGAAPIWRLLMEKFLAGTEIENFKMPANISRYPICRSNGLLLRRYVATSSATIEYFINGTEPKRFCNEGYNLSLTPSPSVSPSPTQPSSTPTPYVTPTVMISPTDVPTPTQPPITNNNLTPAL